MNTAFRIFQKALKAVAWTVTIVVILVLLLIAAILLPPVQNRITDIAVDYLEEKIGTEVQLKNIYIGFPKDVVIEGLYVEDQQADTLAYLRKLKVDVDMLDLLDNKLNIQKVVIDGLTAHIHRSSPDSTFNFDFIPEAFSGSEKSESTETDTSSTEPFQIDVKNVQLTNLYGSFRDDVSGLELNWDLGQFSTTLNDMDLQQLLFDADDLHLANTSVDMIQRPSPPPSSEEPDTGSTDLIVRLNNLNLENVHWSFDMQEEKQRMGVDVGTFAMTPASFRLAERTIDADKIRLHDSHYYLIQEKLVSAQPAVDEPPSEQPSNPLAVFPWKIELNALDIQNQSFVLDDENAKRTPGQFNAAHMDFRDIAVELSDLDYQVKSARVNLDRISGTEINSGVQLEQFQSTVSIDQQSASLGTLTLKTPRSRLALDAKALFRDFSEISENPESISIELDISESHIDLSDLLPFAPELKDQIPDMRNGGLLVEIDTEMDGKIADLNIERFKAVINQSTRVDLIGRVSGLPDVQKASYRVQLNNLSSGRRAVRNLAPPNAIPDAIRVPESFAISGLFEGTFDAFTSELAFNSSSGDVDITAEMDSPADDSKTYHATIQTDNLNLRKLLANQDSLGLVSLEFELSGSGTSLDSLTAQLEGQIRSLEYREYTYRDLDLLATANRNEYDVEATMKDSLLNFKLQACADLSPNSSNTDSLKEPYFHVNFDLIGADLRGMGFSEDDFRVRGRFQAEAVGDSLNKMDGHLSLGNMLFIREGERIPMDSVSVDLRTSSQQTMLTLKSGAINGAYRSNIQIDDMQRVVMNHINNYYKLNDSANVALETRDHYFEFDFDLEPTPALTNVLVPDLTSFSPGKLTGSFRQSTGVFELDILIPSITYQDIRIDSLDFTVQSAGDSLNYRLDLAEAGTKEYAITNTSLYGSLANQQLHASLDVRDTLNQHSLFLSGAFQQDNGNFRFSLDPEGMIINAAKWDVPEDHYLAFGKQGVLARNMRFKRDKQLVLVESEQQELNAPLVLRFDGFEIADIAQAIDYEKDIAKGEINGKVRWTFPDSIPRFNADMQIDNLHFMGSPLGILDLQAQNSPRAIEADVNLKGGGNDVNVKGQLTLTPSNKLDVAANIRRFDAASIDPFTGEYVDSLSGALSGKVAVTGPLDAPQFKGNLTFDDFRFVVPLLGTSYRLGNETINMDNTGFALKQFTITDVNGKKATLDGKIKTPGSGYDQINFNLNADINQFLILNSPDSKDAFFFGKVLLSSSIKVTGDTDQPVIEGSANIVKGSDLSVVIPESEAKVESSGGIDEFVDRYPIGTSIMTRTVNADTTMIDLRGIDLRADLSINKETSLKLYLDQRRDNYVRARGDASLIFGIDPSGKVTLTGRYEIASGEYQLVYRTVIRRTFDIRQGSNIVWIGDPLQAELDITAQHTVETDALGLIQDQLATSNQAELNRYRQELAFWLLLHLGGELAEPSIDFDIELPPESRGVFNGQVQAKLKQLNEESSESELNKQVFALLVLGQFLPSDPTSAGGGASAAARSSVSRLLNNQLEKITDKYIQGVDLNLSLDSYEDYSTGQAEGRTELNVGVEKEFLNKRLTVSVGGSIDLEGRYRRQQQATDLIGDISVEYRLTEDGFWRLRGFRKNSYEGIIDGEITETGASLIFSRSYNELHEIFQPADDPEEVGRKKPPKNNATKTEELNNE